MNDQNGSFNLNDSPKNPVPQPTEPLNTGNGLENNEPHQIPLAPDPPVSTITTQSTQAENFPNPEKNFKKYIIIVLFALLLIGGGAAAYYFYFSNLETTDTNTATSEPDNTLSTKDDPEISPEMEELEEVVEDLKDVYSEQSSDTSAPPSITIDLSESNEEDTEKNTEKEAESKPKKIAR